MHTVNTRAGIIALFMGFIWMSGVLSATLPRHHYSMDQTSDIYVHDSVRGNNGYTVNASHWVPGRIGNAHYFAGESPTFDVNYCFSNMTITFWFKTTVEVTSEYGTAEWYNGYGIVDAHSNEHTNTWGISMLSGGVLAWGNGFSVANHTVRSDDAYNDGQWHFAAFVRQTGQTNTILKIITNNNGWTENSTTIACDTECLMGDGQLTLGRLHSKTNGYWVGTLDDVRIYTSSLAYEDIVNLIILGGTTGTGTTGTTGTTGSTGTTGTSSGTGTTGITLTENTGTEELTTNSVTDGFQKEANKLDSSDVITTPAIIGISAGAATFIACCVLIPVIIVRRRRNAQVQSYNVQQSNEHIPSKVTVTSEPYSNINTTTEETSYAPIVSEIKLSTRERGIFNKVQSWEIQESELVFEDMLGRGSFGVVYKGKWRLSPVAIKKIATTSITEKEIGEFMAEAELLMHLRPHINVVQLMGVCFQPLCIVSELCEEGSLFSRIYNKPPMLLKVKLSWMKDIAAGMLHLHQEKIIHRDLAARNILISNRRAKISDFGLSRSTETENSSGQTQSNVGPIKWMSPESMLHRIYSIKSDVWAFGVLMYEIIAQSEPYPGLDKVQVAGQVCAKTLRITFPNGTSQELVKIAGRCMEWEADSRPDFYEIFNLLGKVSL